MVASCRDVYASCTPLLDKSVQMWYNTHIGIGERLEAQLLPDDHIGIGYEW
jgi:hypothetical protein